MTGDESAADGESRQTGRWRGLAGATLVVGGLGLFTRTSALLLASAVGVALLAYAHAMEAPPPTLAVSRSVSDPDPATGERVTVTVRVENVGDRPIPGLRVADGVPTGWSVVDGEPTHGTALWPGAATAFTYTVTVGAGQREFDPVTVLLRDAAGVVERRTTLTCEDGFETDAPASVEDTPALPTALTRLAGREAVDASGDGVAFRALREYRRGDPRSRIDWRRRARTGDLATVELQAEHRLTVVFVVDARAAATLAASSDDPTAVQRSLDAVERLYAAVTDAGHRAGVAALGPTRTWVPPGRGEAHRRRVHEQLSTAATVARDDDSGDGAAWVRTHLPERATVVCCTPLCDDAVADLARRLDASGYPTAVVSPDPTTAGTAGRRLVALERRRRCRRLRADGVGVLDWPPDVDVATALARGGWLS